MPTWSVGLEQSQGDVRRYATEGYGKNSLLFSCIAEKATSFAAIEPRVQRRDGSLVADHRLVRLLKDPNPEQDGADFAELLATHFDVAGNVYVRLVEVSPDPERRRAFATYPVQELRIIRPDYVSIEPGRTPAEDRYVVRVDGEEKARLSRREVLHIHEPLVVNDFYGEPKLARLQREASIDLQMSDFELAFFRNAGVPMGLLSVKGTKSPEEVQAIKGAFRKAYNGARKWFDLLVLNTDQAAYTPLGMKQSEMEMDSTRFHVESRVCSVYGVPGILVGARYALQTVGPNAYEQAEHAFWAETMVPFVLRFARAFTKWLLPLFAVTADRGAQLTYDFSVVRALQEDRSRKLREVVRLILTGGFTVNQALALSGLPTQAGGDFYVRNGNQVVVGLDGVITPMSGGEEGGPNLDNPLEGAARLDAGAVVEEALTIFRRP